MNEVPSSTPSAASSDFHSPLESRSHKNVCFENSEVSILGVNAVLMAIALVFAGVMLLAAWVLFATKAGLNQGEAGHYSAPAEEKPAAPRLEPLDYGSAVAINVFRTQLEKQRELHNYGATSDEGFVHVPIEQAIKFTAKSFTRRQHATALPDHAFGLVGGGEANSGRLFTEAPRWMRQKK